MVLKKLYKVFCDECGFAAGGCTEANDALTQARKQNFKVLCLTSSTMTRESVVLMNKDLCPDCWRKWYKENGPQKT